MTPYAAGPLVDPVAILLRGRLAGPDRHPTPLDGVRYAVAIRGGLAEVRMARRFVNREAGSIEAVLTFPLPVHAVLFELLLRVDGRTLSAQAAPRAGARAGYEAAIEEGRLAVLHEELLRGIHMLSVGPVPAGAAIEVEAAFALSLSLLEGGAQLRLPLTVGEVYGRSGLAEVDDLVAGAAPGTVTLEVACDCGPVRLAGGQLVAGRATLPDNRPIELTVSPWAPGPCTGRAADGRRVELDITPAPAGEARLDAVLLVDRSGSMSEPHGGAAPGASKHAVAARELGRALAGLAYGDRVELWEFSDRARRVGAGDGERAARLPGGLTPPGGGTRIGAALQAVIEQSAARDILLLTDGKSHDIDVAALAAQGRRCVVVLIGEDSLEANVGHLAALTGGDVLVAGPRGLRPAVTAALALLRQPYAPARLAAPDGLDLRLRWGGAAIATRWTAGAAPAADAPGARAVAAFAASLALRLLPAEAATAVAVAEGLAGPFTSLVLVDREGAVATDLPSLRKIALPAPEAFACSDMPLPAPARARAPAAQPPRPGSAAPSLGRLFRHIGDAFRERPASPPRPRVLPPAPPAPPAQRLPWSQLGGALAAGELGGLAAAQRAAVLRLAARPEVVAFAAAHGLHPLLLAIALLARADAGRDRHAARLAHRLLGAGEPPGLDRLAAAVGLG